ncbi:MAG TPA: carboxypeptidase-like regulatory domain-containing protein [Chitinophagaceae bacterium]|nr:carboxypeptidase-like regulatory domain-containing protein [Chitinophagaceae bacterium]
MKVTYFLKKALMAGTLLLFSWGPGRCQPQSVSGQIRSAADKEAITIATICVPGTSNGTVSDGEGHYPITGIRPGDSLLFSFIGYQKKTDAVGERSTINITLQAHISRLNQLVVIRYGE